MVDPPPSHYTMRTVLTEMMIINHLIICEVQTLRPNPPFVDFGHLYLVFGQIRQIPIQLPVLQGIALVKSGV